MIKTVIFESSYGNLDMKVSRLKTKKNGNFTYIIDVRIDHCGKYLPGYTYATHHHETRKCFAPAKLKTSETIKMICKAYFEDSEKIYANGFFII